MTKMLEVNKNVIFTQLKKHFQTSKLQGKNILEPTNNIMPIIGL